MVESQGLPKIEAETFPEGQWWTGEVEDGHSVLVVSKAEIQLGFDPWGYPPGELKAKTFSLLPNPPSLITIEQLMNELSILPGKPSRGLRKAIDGIFGSFVRRGSCDLCGSMTIPFGLAITG